MKEIKIKIINQLENHMMPQENKMKKKKIKKKKIKMKKKMKKRNQKKIKK